MATLTAPPWPLWVLLLTWYPVRGLFHAGRIATLLVWGLVKLVLVMTFFMVQMG